MTDEYYFKNVLGKIKKYKASTDLLRIKMKLGAMRQQALAHYNMKLDIDSDGVALLELVQFDDGLFSCGYTTRAYHKWGELCQLD